MVTSSSNVRSNNYQIEPDIVASEEKFDCCYGDAIIEDNGCLVMLPNSGTNAEICGKLEYSTGKYRIRLKIEKSPHKLSIFIGIISKLEPMGTDSCNSSSSYEWADYDYFFLAGKQQSSTIGIRCSHTVENDIIKLVIDCFKRMICYKNEGTKKSQQLKIDINKCPFPWQLHVNLIGLKDQVRLLSATSIS